MEKADLSAALTFDPIIIDTCSNDIMCGVLAMKDTLLKHSKPNAPLTS